MIAPIHPHLHIKQKREESNDKVELTNQKNQTIISHVTQS